MLVYAFWQGPSRLGISVVLLGTALGILGWFGALWLCRHPALDEVKGVLSPIIRKMHLFPA